MPQRADGARTVAVDDHDVGSEPVAEPPWDVSVFQVGSGVT
jgi:hypothetical protein